MEIIIGLGRIQAQVLQPVLTDECALVDVAGLLIELGEAADVALDRGHLLPKLGIFVEPIQQIGHILINEIADINQEFSSMA